MSNKTGFAGNVHSQYDAGMVIKDSADFYGQAIRTTDARSVADKYYSHFRASYNVDNLPTQVTYYRGISPHVTAVGCTADVAGSLNNKYFSIRSNPSDALYHVWFNVNGAGVNPAPANSIGIEIPIDTNDTAAIVATAVSLVINSLFSSVFSAVKSSSVVTINSFGLGTVTNSADFNTGFTISNTAGTQEITNSISITYSGTDPVFNGQTLKGYVYNIFKGQFERSDVGAEGDVGLLEGIQYDDIQATYPSSTVENYAYYLNAVLQATIEVTYTNSTKEVLTRARRI